MMNGAYRQTAVVWMFFWTVSRALHLSSQEWQSGSRKCLPCSCSIQRPEALGGTLVKHVNCSNLYLDHLEATYLPDDTEFLDISRTSMSSSPVGADVYFNGSSLLYHSVPTQLVNATKRLQKLKYLNLSGNSFNEFHSSPFSHLEFLSGILGLEVHSLSSDSFQGLSHLTFLGLRTPMQNLPDDVFSALAVSELTLHLEFAETLPQTIFNPLNTSLRTLTVRGDRMSLLPESLLDSLLLLQKFTLRVTRMETVPEHLLHGSTLFRSLKLRQGKMKPAHIAAAL